MSRWVIVTGPPLYLFAEQWNDGSVGTEDIAETRGYETCGGSFGISALIVEQRLYVYFRDTFRCSHYVGGIDCFVGGNHHEFFNTVFYR